MSSLQGRLTRGVVLSLGAVLLVTGTLLFVAARVVLRSNFDHALEAKARALGTLLEQRDGRIDFEFAGETMPEFTAAADPEYFQLWAPDGALLELSETLDAPRLERRHGPVEDPLFWDLALPDGRPGRAIGVELPVDAPDDAATEAAAPLVVLVVARSRESLEASLAWIAGTLAATAVLVCLATSLLLPRVVRRGLRPLRDASRQVEAIEARSLSRRLDASGAPDELAACLGKVNELLQRLEQAFDRERRLTANITHELRTPLAELQTAADLARRWPEDAAVQAAALRTVATVSARMSAAVDALLRLRRIETGQALPQLVAVDGGAAVQDAVAAQRARARERGVDLEGDYAACTLHTDRALLATALANMVGNAVDFTPRGGRVRCAVAQAEKGVEILISNPAPDLVESDLPRLIEPFWQKDGARTAAGHPGLGLTLVASIAAALGGRLRFSLAGGELHAQLVIVTPEPSPRTPFPSGDAP